MTTPREMQDLLAEALGELRNAAQEMFGRTIPAVPLPRPRVFTIAPGVTWPSTERTEAQFLGILVWKHPEERGVGELPYTRYSLTISGPAKIAAIVLERCKYQPRLVLRALRRIQAAAAWCRARAEGRRRAAREILRQQARAEAALGGEIAIRALAKIDGGS